MSLCIDLVLNHTAREHRWAQGWLAGDPEYAGFYTAFPDRTMPDAYDATIPEVFPDRAPGSFSWVPEACGGAGGWVWTTFWPYQWDLDYTNPEVTLAMLGEITWLANRGVDVFRMDAVPFMWKRLGTSCQNQPEGHLLLQLLHALTRLAAPGVVFKAEAIVAPGGPRALPRRARPATGPECELAYHNQLMVLLWSGLATGDARLPAAALRPHAAHPAHHVVGHLRARPRRHRLGDHRHRRGGRRGRAASATGASSTTSTPGGSPARSPGARCSRRTRPPATRASPAARRRCAASRRRWNGGDDAALEAGIRRLVLLYSVVYSFGGIPLLYMGDELALRNDTGYLADPERAPDNRWMHRPPMDWTAAARRSDPATLEGRVFGWMQRLGEVRRALPALRAGGECAVLDVGNAAVLGWRRRHPRSGTFVGLANLSRAPQTVDADTVTGFGTYVPVLTSDGPPELRADRVLLPGLGFAWYAEP